LQLFATLNRLQGLVDSGTILKMYHADRDDLELLATIADLIREHQAEQGGETNNAD
jgi:hypothetical protein